MISEKIVGPWNFKFLIASLYTKSVVYVRGERIKKTFDDFLKSNYLWIKKVSIEREAVTDNSVIRRKLGSETINRDPAVVVIVLKDSTNRSQCLKVVVIIFYESKTMNSCVNVAQSPHCHRNSEESSGRSDPYWRK